MLEMRDCLSLNFNIISTISIIPLSPLVLGIVQLTEAIGKGFDVWIKTSVTKDDSCSTARVIRF